MTAGVTDGLPDTNAGIPTYGMSGMFDLGRDQRAGLNEKIRGSRSAKAAISRRASSVGVVMNRWTAAWGTRQLMGGAAGANAPLCVRAKEFTKTQAGR
jgi:hypothetical protein